MTDYTCISLKQSTKTVFEELRDDLATDYGGRPTQDQALRELIESYRDTTEETVYISNGDSVASTFHHDRECPQVRSENLPLKPVTESEVPDIATACIGCAGGLTPDDVVRLGESHD
jgi:hypothetical protein